MPGSPVEVKIQSRSSPPNMPPLPPVNPGGPRPVSFTPTALPNGINHSPPTLNGAPSPPQRFSNGPSSSSSSSLTNQQLPATCGARQLSKLKRFLTTLQQFGNDISPEIGEKVRTLVLALVNSTVTIEEFHCKLQEATNFPLRPFVIPFLKANLPLLQRELLHCARAAKQTPSQYLAQHEHILLNTNTTSPADSSELLIEVNGNGKRHSPDRREDSSFEREPLPTEPPAKRVCTISPAPRHSPALTIPLMNPSGQFHPTPPPLQHYTLEDIATSHLYRDPSKMLEHREIRDRHSGLGLNGGYQDELVDHRLTEREWADEWKHLDHVRNGRVCGKLCGKQQPSVPPAPVGDFLVVGTVSRLSWWLVEEQAGGWWGGLRGAVALSWQVSSAHGQWKLKLVWMKCLELGSFSCRACGQVLPWLAEQANPALSPRGSFLPQPWPAQVHRCAKCSQDMDSEHE